MEAFMSKNQIKNNILNLEKVEENKNVTKKKLVENSNI